ncbi:MAG: nucleoid-associated protein [Gammaproteobacteria bacterium]
MNNKAKIENLANEVTLIIKPRIKVVAAITIEFERNKKLEGSPFDPKSGTVWDLTNETALNFVEKIEEKFRKKNKLHGMFDPKRYHLMPENLKSYLDSKIEFMEFVSVAAASLKSQANDPSKTGLSGGNIIFVHYKTNDEHDIGRILIVMVGQKSGFEFDANLQPKSLSSIDVNALKQAAYFDLNLFDVGYPANDGEDAYLRFIQGNSKSLFFQDALGCNQSISNKDSAKNVIQAFRDFAKEAEVVRGTKDKIEEQLHQLFIKKSHSKENKTITLVEIQNVIDRNLPLDSSIIGKFSRFVNERQYEVSERFEPTTQTAKSLIQLEVRDSSANYECKVKSTAIGKVGSGKPVIVGSDFSTITFNLDSESQSKLSALLEK